MRGKGGAPHRAHRRLLPESLRAVKRISVLLLFVIAACSPGGAQDGGKKGPASTAAPGDALGVTLLEMAPRAVPVSFEAVGRTEGSREVQVRARVSGILERQLYNEGDALQETERLKRLADRRAISQKEADQAASAARQSSATVQVAQARVRQAELNLSYTNVTAPIGGVTGRALQSIGSLVAPNNDSALLTTLTRGDPIWVRFALSEAEFARVRGGEQKAIEVKLEL